jgi:hydrogenase expression/formation protein HypE
MKNNKDVITLAHGSGGKEMQELIDTFKFTNRAGWENYDADSASVDITADKKLFFTTDSFVVDPIFFPGGNIGHLAFSGTVNDLAVMGANPLGLSLGFVIEEGFPREDLMKIIKSIDELSLKTKIPIVTGDTKVMEKGKIDKIIINSSGVGIAKKEEALTKKVDVGDKLIISGGLGEHAVALLSKRFDYETDIVTDSKPLVEEINSVKHLIKRAKDPTRGGIAAVLNELAGKHNFGILLNEESIPAKKEVRKVAEMLGINLYELASEGRFVCITSERNAEEVESRLQKFNKDARIIGEITEGNKVIMQTILGKRILAQPTGRIVPRIC